MAGVGALAQQQVVNPSSSGSSILANGLANGAATGMDFGTPNMGVSNFAANPIGGMANNAVFNVNAQQGTDPNTGLPISVGSTGTGSTGTTDQAYYDQLAAAANSQLGNLGNQATIGNQNIQDAYNTSYNQLLGSKNIADRNYQTSKDQTLQDNTLARGNIQAGVGQQANSLQRLLGAHGAGSSSAALYAAPYAAARTGAVQNQQVQQAYGRNQQALDTNYGDYNNQYKTSLTDLGHQRDLQSNQLQSQIDQNKSSLLAQLASIAQSRTGNAGAAAPYQAQIDQLGNQITSLGQQYANPVIQAPTPAYKAPTLESYNYNTPTTQVNTNAPGGTSAVSPFLSVLLGAQDKNKGTIQ